MEQRGRCGLLFLIILGFCVFLFYSWTGLKQIDTNEVNSHINSDERILEGEKNQGQGWKAQQRKRLDLIEKVCRSYNQSSELTRR